MTPVNITNVNKALDALSPHLTMEGHDLETQVTILALLDEMNLTHKIPEIAKCLKWDEALEAWNATDAKTWNDSSAAIRRA